MRAKNAPCAGLIVNLPSYYTWPIDTWGHWDAADDGRYFVPSYLSGSDYSGNLVEKSNHAFWCDEYADGNGKWWADISGGYGTFGVIVDMEQIPDDARETLESLDSYCLLDESRHSEMEIEAQNEAWNDWARRDFVKGLQDIAGFEFDPDIADKDAAAKLFWDASDRAGEYWSNEQGDSMYIDIDRVIARGKIERDDVLALLPAKEAIEAVQADTEERIAELQAEIESLRALLARAGIDADSAAARMAQESFTLGVRS